MAHGKLKEHIAVWNVFCRKYLIAITEIYLGEEILFYIWQGLYITKFVLSLRHLNRPWSWENERMDFFFH